MDTTTIWCVCLEAYCFIVLTVVLEGRLLHVICQRKAPTQTPTLT
jgi:hypothetical protein